MGRWIVLISLPQPIIIGLLKIKKSNHHIQFNKHNNNLQNKMVEQTYYKILSTTVNELLHSLLAVLTPHAHPIELGSRQRDIAYNEKKLLTTN